MLCQVRVTHSFTAPYTNSPSKHRGNSTKKENSAALRNPPNTVSSHMRADLYNPSSVGYLARSDWLESHNGIRLYSGLPAVFPPLLRH